MSIQEDVVNWRVRDVCCHPGGPVIVPVQQAPFGRALSYRRAAGEVPPDGGCAGLVRSQGWLADLGQHGLPELLFGLAAATALHELTPNVPLHYSGPLSRLMERCSLPLESSGHSWGPHLIRTATRSPVRFRVDHREPPTWLDQLQPGWVEVHASLPMRHYLALEQSLGTRLLHDEASLPRFPTTERGQSGHVVLVTVSDWPNHLDLGIADFAEVARELRRGGREPLRFTVITPRNVTEVPPELAGLPVDIVQEPAAVDCVDLFASAELVVGANVGLTALAALVTTADGTGPEVVGLHSWHSYAKWTTGSRRQHSIATRFSQMLALADRSAEPADLADGMWGEAADLHTVPRELVADFAGRCAGWW